jgi:hypothetical protein
MMYGKDKKKEKKKMYSKGGKANGNAMARRDKKAMGGEMKKGKPC